MFTLAKVGDNDFKPPFPMPCTIRQAMTQYVDLQGHVRASTAAAFLPYLRDKAEAAWLSDIVASANREAFTKLVDVPRRSIVSLLCKELSSAVIPLQDLLHILPYMQPRYYTISSSSSRYPNKVHITVSVMESKAQSGEVFRGLTSSYLQSLEPNKSTCRVFVRPSSFRLPKAISTPIIMIGPGTGVAPMRALLQEREEQAQRANAPTGSNSLYFGCQSASRDFIYRNELEAFVASKTLSKLEVAFSREQLGKVYVQHLLQREADSDALVSSIDFGAYIYVCGGTSMGADVMETVISVVEKKKSISRNAAEAFVKDLQSKGQYVQELWSA
jgi:NADPH-ferrihemoprotein reductase